MLNNRLSNVDYFYFFIRVSAKITILHPLSDLPLFNLLFNSSLSTISQTEASAIVERYYWLSCNICFDHLT